MPSRTFLLLFMFVPFSVPIALAETGQASIQGTKEGSAVAGKASFKDTAEGLLMNVEISGATPGKHGFHIHQFGSCADAGKAAGAHFNPDHVGHGYLPKDGFLTAHAGDFGNIDVAPDGTGKLDVVIPNLTLSGSKYSVGGRALILHEKEDDFSQPAGNAGDRIGCGTIVITGE